jgi:glycosyltransferase involved in cell wall biosynthesis
LSLDLVKFEIKLAKPTLLMSKLTVIIPAFNESKTILNILQRVLDVDLMDNIQKEIVIVDDFSTDATQQVVQQFIDANPNQEFQYFKMDKNRGKGAAIHKGIELASGDYVIVQDADLEYDPDEYNILLKPILNGSSDVVYGSRFIGGKPHRVMFFGHTIGNKILTLLSNIFTNLNLTDMETCYKLFKRDVIKSLDLKEQRFGFEPEVTAKIAKIKGLKIMEVGISYYGRTYQEGKKIGWKDAFRAIYCIIKYNLVK